MPAAIYNPIADKGADYSFAMVFTDGSGNALPLSAGSVTAPIFAKEGDTNSVASFSVVIDPVTTGRATFILDEATSASLPFSKPYYEIWLQQPNDGALSRYAKGILNLDK